MAYNSGRYFETVRHGNATVGATSAALSDLPGVKAVAFQADSDNAGSIHVQKAATATTAAGWELQAGESTPWLPTNNLNEWAAIADGAGYALRWMALS